MAQPMRGLKRSIGRVVEASVLTTVSGRWIHAAGATRELSKEHLGPSEKTEVPGCRVNGPNDVFDVAM